MKKIIIILDSCNYKNFERANTPNMDQWGPTQVGRSWSHTTLPVFTSMVCNGKEVSPTYTKIKSVRYLDDLAKNGVHRYFFTDNPHLHPTTDPIDFISRKFTTYECIVDDPYNHDKLLVESALEVDAENYLIYLWLGSTHQPYNRGLDRNTYWQAVLPLLKKYNDRKIPYTFVKNELNLMRDQQIKSIEYIDSFITEVMKLDPDEIIVTADHGESFGDGGVYGHGNSMDSSQIEVPYIRWDKYRSTTQPVTQS